MTIFDAPSYPWHEPAARQLHGTLVDLYPAPQSALLVARYADLNTAMIRHEQPVLFLWKDILDTASTARRLRPLVQEAHDLLQADHPGREFLADLLAARPVTVSAEPRLPDGRTSFLRDDDTVSVPEAMLFGDDLTLAAGRLPGLIGTLQRLVAVVPGVCKLTVEFAGGGTQFGTAFRIAPELLLTNWHVLHRKDDGAPATTVTAEFGYDEDESGKLLGGTPIRCVLPFVAGDAADDWLVLRTLDRLEDEWPVLPLATAAVPAVNGAAFVIQHPYGSRKRVGFVRNQVSHVDDRVVHYLTDTAVGSSGSPVVDADGNLIALHHRGGQPQSVAGRQPIRKNEGIRISRVAAGLAAAGIIDAASGDRSG